MAVLFSAVTLTADNNQVEFLAAGIPRDSDDLEGWTAYDEHDEEPAGVLSDDDLPQVPSM